MICGGFVKSPKQVSLGVQRRHERRMTEPTLDYLLMLSPDKAHCRLGVPELMAPAAIEPHPAGRRYLGAAPEVGTPQRIAAEGYECQIVAVGWIGGELGGDLAAWASADNRRSYGRRSLRLGP